MKEKEYDITPSCRYCENAASIRDGETMVCTKKGVVSAGFVCRKYAFDPLKRHPRPRPKLQKLEEL
ncbi:MAG: hypothetical protein E7616_04655 [Ruminococcaceae bacterium]|nr:hypothetical protein [Oscillospiraceae bacterium]